MHEDQKALAFPRKAVRDSKVPLIFSSDWPVVPVEVMHSVQAAVAPRLLGGNWSDQRQSLYDTLQSYTATAAYAEFNEDQKGRLAPGMMADIVVLSADLDTISADNLAKVVPIMTICGGRIAHEGMGI